VSGGGRSVDPNRWTGLDWRTERIRSANVLAIPPRSPPRSRRSRDLFPSLTVDENLRVLLPQAEQRQAVYRQFALPATRRRVPAGLLSGGEQQLLALAYQATVRSDLELRLPLVEVAITRHSHQASRMVRDVLDLVVRHGYIQTVLDTAPRLMQHLLSDWDRYPRSEHLEALVAAAVESRQPGRNGSHPGPLADPLTEAEIRVLRRLPQRLSYGDIASDLHLSLNTVKTHLRHTYTKLGVTSRSAAIKRGAALGLL
jgi:ATP/maltotriose-dependent transcriptional regulator MalT